MSYSLFVVVPTLDSFELLPRLCSSLQEQTWSGWSVLFVDGPSSARHREWLNRFCLSDSRFSWTPQDPEFPGIFGAMNQGFAASERLSVDWLLFWGSDDWAASSSVLEDVFSGLQRSRSKSISPDLIVCRGRYVNSVDKSLKRPTVFCSGCWLDSSAYRRALWFGATPPHQSTFFGVGARRRLANYAPGFRLSADLDYFLQLGRQDLSVLCLDLELVQMADGGISGQQTQRRLQEVCRAYRRVYGWRWWFPFIARYVRRLVSLVPAFG